MWNTNSKDWSRIGVDLHGETDAEKAMLAGGGGANTPYGSLTGDKTKWIGTSATRQGDDDEEDKDTGKKKKKIDTSQYD